MATTTPNFGWDIPQSTDLVKDGATAIAALGTDIDTALVDLKGGTTGQVLSKASNTDLDFTWSSVDPLTILDAKGDLITATAADTPARLAVGTNNQVLMADSSTSTGLKWGTVSSGGMTLIQETVASGLTSLSFSSIPNTYKSLLLVYNGLITSNNATAFNLRINNESASGTYRGLWFGQNSGFANGTLVGQAVTPTNFLRNVISSDGENTANGWLQIDNYASTTRLKNYMIDYSLQDSAIGSIYYTVNAIFNSTSAISSLDIVRTVGTGTFSNATNTSIRLYGVS